MNKIDRYMMLENIIEHGVGIENAFIIACMFR